MKLLYVSKYQFTIRDGITYALPAYGNRFWEKYLDVFDSVDVLAEEVKKYLNNGTLAQITDERISVEILPCNTAPRDFVNDRAVKKILEEKIRNAEAILIKPSCRKGIMAIRLAKKYNKPYMVELTGDLKRTLSKNPNLLKRIYNPFLHRQILRAIKDCEFGLYVTEKHLQKVYPISGKQCGCTDTVLPYITEASLQKRIQKIEGMPADEIHIGMVTSYHDNRKGLDTAIKAIGLIRKKKVTLHVLGLGTEEDRQKWLDYAKNHGAEGKLVFDPSLSGVEKVLQWNDTMDLCILPSRSEGLPRCVVESISRGCPNIISNVCGMPELVGRHWVHEPEDHRRLAELIEELTGDPELMKQVATENFNHSKNYEHSVLKAKRNAFLEEFKAHCRKKAKN